MMNLLNVGRELAVMEYVSRLFSLSDLHYSMGNIEANFTAQFN